MSESKQFEASIRHIQKARKKGQVLRSTNLSRICSLVAVFISINLVVTFSWVAPEILLKCYLANNLSDLYEYFSQVGWLCLLVIASSLGVAWLVAVVTDIFQVGFLFQPNLLAIDPNRLNPIEGIRKLFKGWRDIPLRLILVAALVCCSWLFVKRFLLSALQDLSDFHLLQQSISSFTYFTFVLLLCLFIYGLADYMVQRLRYYKELRMTLKEVRDEHKESEGDPYLKAMRKDIHEQLLMQELVQHIKRSKVIVVEKM